MAKKEKKIKEKKVKITKSKEDKKTKEKKVKEKKVKPQKVKQEKHLSLIDAINFVFSEFFGLLKSIFIGIYGLFDFIVFVVMKTISYFKYGSGKISTFFRNLFIFIWRKGILLVVNEIGILFTSVKDAVTFIFSSIFISIPMSIYNFFKKQYDHLKNVKQAYVDSYRQRTAGKTAFQRLSEYINSKWENLSFVKEARRKKEAKLKPISIDPNSEDTLKNPIKVTYRYLARNTEGKIVKGYFPAFSKMDVFSYLTDEKMIVYEITSSKLITFLHGETSAFRTKMKTKDLIFWLTQLSTYIKAGIPLTDSVKVLSQQDKRKKYRPIYESLIYELTMGQPFSEALKRQGNSFPPLLTNMVKSAEMVGNIESTLDEMADYYQEVEDTKRAIISAISYPAIVFVFAIAIVIFMLTYIVPQFVAVYESMDAEINIITQICLNISAFLKTKYLYLIIGLVTIIALYIYLYKNIKAFRVMMQKLFMHIPVIGKIIIYKEMSLFARTFSTLQKNNILLSDSIEILAKITNNEIYKDVMTRTIDNLIKGEKMSDTFKDHWAIPDVAYFMIVTGESTGELAEMLEKVADYYQKLERQSVNLIKTFIEPVMIVTLAVIVGFILVSVLIPMFGLYETIQIE